MIAHVAAKAAVAAGVLFLAWVAIGWFVDQAIAAVEIPPH